MRLLRSLGVSRPLLWNDVAGEPLLVRLSFRADRSMLADGDEERYVSRRDWLTV